MSDSRGDSGFVRSCTFAPFFPLLSSAFANLFCFFFADAMPEKDDTVLKMALDAKRNQKKKNRSAGAGEHSASAGSPRVNLDERSPKRGRHEPSNLNSERAFVLPPCYKDGGYFEKFP